jgi:RHS repeat-associated protein
MKLKGDKAQYVYDIQGNKVRQFTGMTSPLTLTVSEVTDDEKDTFSYAGKTYAVTISGKKKSDDIRETKYEYDGKNQLIAYTDPEGRTETYTYDINSNLTKTVDKNGNTQKNTYDYQNRLTEMVAKEKKTGKETTHTYTYNAYGEVATQDDTAFVYGDVSGQVTKETTKLTKNKDVVKNYSYDSEGNKSAFSVNIGDDTKLSLQYTYDGESKLTAVTDENGNQVAGYDYDIDGNLSKRTASGNNMTTTYAYDYQNHLTSLKNETESAGVISEYTSEYLVNGQKSKETSDTMDEDGKKSKKTATYTYDLLGRITKETKTGSEDISYTYDSNNNRKKLTVGKKVTSYQYNKNDELLRTDTLNQDTEEDSVVIYKNDKNGNQLATVNRYEIPSDKKDSIYVDIDVTLGDNRLNENVVNHYNALNQLTKTLTKNYKVSFTYDAEGLRTSKTVNGEKTVFVWDGDQLVMELSEGGKVQKRYIRGNDLVYADKGNNTEKQYYVTDPHGNVVQLTDESGKVTQTYEYDSFGNEVNPDKQDDNPFRYCGEYYDKETKEIYLRARYYQPAVGRFLTRDTYTGEEDEPLTLHLYTYCANDGVNAWDPSGNKKTSYKWKIAKHKIYKVKQERKSSILFEYFAANMAVDTDGRDKVSKKKNKTFNGLTYHDKHHRKETALGVTEGKNPNLSASKVPYIVIQSKFKSKAKAGVGSYCIVYDKVTKNHCFAVVGDVQTANKIGEASVAVLQALNIPVDEYLKNGVLKTVTGENNERFKYIIATPGNKKTESLRRAQRRDGKFIGAENELITEIKNNGSYLYNKRLKKTGYTLENL